MSSCCKYHRSSQGGWKWCFSSYIGVANRENSPQPLTCVCISKLLFPMMCSSIHFWGYFNLSFGSRCTRLPPFRHGALFQQLVDLLSIIPESLRQRSPVSSMTPCLHNPVDSVFILDFLQHQVVLEFVITLASKSLAGSPPTSFLPLCHFCYSFCVPPLLPTAHTLLSPGAVSCCPHGHLCADCPQIQIFNPWLPPEFQIPGRCLTGSLSPKDPKLNGFSFFSETASPLEFFSGNFITLYPFSYNSNLGVIFGSPFSAHSPHIIGKVLQILTSPSLY